MAELAIIALLLVLNGVFAMARIALVSARRPRLQQRAAEGDSGAALALELTKDPERFLSTVQVGITLVGVLAGAFGGASLAGNLTPFLERVPLLAARAEAVAFGLVVAAITYVSLIIGELVPKNLALRNPETIASAMAKPMHWLSRQGFPVVWLLGWSTRIVMRLFGKAEATSGPTSDEVQVLLREGLVTGGVRLEESQMGRASSPSARSSPRRSCSPSQRSSSSRRTQCRNSTGPRSPPAGRASFRSTRGLATRSSGWSPCVISTPWPRAAGGSR